MFILDEYESASGHRYYRGIRFCDRIVLLEKVGLYCNFTFLDSIELYAFNCSKLELVQKQDFDRMFRSESFVRSESERMIKDYLMGAVKMQLAPIPMEQVDEQARMLADGCLKSFLDPDFNTKLTQILPSIQKK